MPTGHYVRSEEYKKIMSNVAKKNGYGKWFKGKKQSKQQIENRRLLMMGHKVSEETKRKISNSHKGIGHNLETRKKLRSIHLGKKLSIGTRLKMRVAQRIRHFQRLFNQETRRKIGLAHSGSKSNWWQGGISFEPYTTDWTKTLKRSIRERDKYICYICKEEGSQVHHIDYDKTNCCPENLITLCVNCHAKTNNNRKKWIDYFYIELNMGLGVAE